MKPLNVIWVFTALSIILAVSLYRYLTPVELKTDCGRKFEGAGMVFGGEKTRQNSWPWLVALFYLPKNQFICGGSLISSKHVLSAAHCFKNKLQQYTIPHYYVTVFVGIYNLYKKNEPGSTKHEISMLIIHPEWKSDDPRFDADISMIVLYDDVIFNYFVEPICLPQAIKNEPSDTGFVVGWGQSNKGKLLSPTPNELLFPVISKEVCFNDVFKLIIIASKRCFCAGFLGQSKSVCFGDSGSGFYSYDSGIDRFYIRGIVSASLINGKYCNREVYSIFTNVASFINWIKTESEKSLKWKEIDFKCHKTKTNGLSYLSCTTTIPHTYKSIKNTNLKIGSVFGVNQDIDEIGFNFKPSKHIFSDVGKKFPKLKIFHIKFTSLKFIQRSNFKNLPQLQVLEMKDNRIEFLPEDVFCDLKNLKALRLNGNKIKVLQEKVFEKISNLVEIDLDANKIKFLPRNLFINNKELKKVRLSKNRIKEIGFDWAELMSWSFNFLKCNDCKDLEHC